MFKILEYYMKLGKTKFWTNHTDIKNKKPSEKADTSSSVTFDHDLQPWPHVLYLGTKFEVCGLKFVRFVAIYNLNLWPWHSVKVNINLIGSCRIVGMNIFPDIDTFRWK